MLTVGHVKQETLDSPGITETGEPTRVLLVEDDPVSLKILEKRISSGNYLVESAIDGVDGLEKFEKFQPQLIISDWMMPRMDGRDLCREIRQRAAAGSIYFILLTARDKHEDIVQALDRGVDEYLIKPCDGPELMARLRAAERLLHLQRALTLSNDRLKDANKRINKELQEISVIQRSLLPQQLPEIPGFSFAAHYQPSTECSGDFYDLLTLSDGRLGIIIGDVSGHGAPAMVAMAVLRMIYRMETTQGVDPATTLARINSQMYEHLPTDQYATMFYGVLDLITGRLDYSSAGHPPPLVLERASHKAEFIPGCEGFPIKLIDPNASYDNHHLMLGVGQSLMLYTDGVTETFNPPGDIYGYERLKLQAGAVASRSGPDTIEHLLTDLNFYRQDRPFGDDVSMLIVGRG